MKVIFSFIENRSGHVHSHLCLHVAFPCGSCATLPHLVPSVKNDCLCTLQFLHNHSTNPLPFLHIPPTPGHHDFDPLTSHKFWISLYETSLIQPWYNELVPVERLVFDEGQLAITAEDFQVAICDLHEL